MTEQTKRNTQDICRFQQVKFKTLDIFNDILLRYNQAQQNVQHFWVVFVALGSSVVFLILQFPTVLTLIVLNLRFFLHRMCLASSGLATEGGQWRK